ncbi:FkbM family methyltransferase [Mycolicibacterium sp. XJ647]
MLDWYSMALRRWASEQDCVTYFGATMTCDPADSVQRTILLFGVWEPAISQLIERNVRSGSVFVDIGANVGYDSLLAASQVGTDGAVVAVEASPDIFARLQRNLAHNPDLSRHVRPVNVAVSDRPGSVDLFDFGPQNVGATTTLASRQGKHVGTVTAQRLGDILTDDELSRVRLIKMDVEGAEPVILNDILDNLDAYPADMDLIIEANPDDDMAAFGRVFDRARAAGFSTWVVENGYSNHWYLRWHDRGLRRLDSVPTERCDLYLTRQ